MVTGKKGLWIVILVISVIGFILSVKSTAFRVGLDYDDSGNYFDPEQGITLSDGAVIFYGFFVALFGLLMIISLLKIVFSLRKRR